MVEFDDSEPGHVILFARDRLGADVVEVASEIHSVPNGDSLVSVRRLRKTFAAASGEPVHAVSDLDLEIRRRAVVALMGPSGSGKSTLLHLIGAMLPADSGQILVDGDDVAAMRRAELVRYRRTVGFVFQRFQLLPALTVLGNVLAPVLPTRPGKEVRGRAVSLLDRVGLSDRLADVPSRLSGGQQQRVAIARALLSRPRLLLADEPTGNLDSVTGREILSLLLEARAEDDVTLVIATHDQAVAERCDVVVTMRDGAIIESDS